MNSDPHTKFINHPGPAPYHLRSEEDSEMVLHRRLIAKAQETHGAFQPARVPTNLNSRSWHKG